MNSKTKMAIILVLLLSLTVIAACAATGKKLQEPDQILNERVSGSINILIDSDNGVMYLVHKGGYGEAMSVMFNPDGTIKIHPDYIEEEK